jgi:cytochrome b561
VMIGIPLLGWATVSTSPLNIPTLLWDAVPFPDLPLERGSRQSAMWANGHKIAAWGALLLILLHIAAALRHHLIGEDDVLARMLPIFKERNSRESAG